MDAPIAIYEIAFDGSKFTYVNPAMSQLLGYSEEELLTMNALDLLADESKRKFQEIVIEAMKGEKTFFSAEYAVRSKSGQSVWGLVHAKVICKDGKPDTVQVFAQDITKRKKIEQELWQAKDDWERTFDAVPDLIAIIDTKHRIVRTNRSMAERIKINPEQAEGLTCYEAIHNAVMPPEFCPHAKTLRDGKEYVAEVCEPRLGGDFIVSTTPLKDQKGRLIGSVHVARDITERKKAELALKESEQLYRTLFDNSDDGFMLVEPVYNKLGECCDIKFLKFNDAYEQQTGAKAADLLGRKASDVIPLLESEIISLSGKVAKTGKSTHTEIYDKYSNKWYDSHYFPYAKGQVGILFRDITERKKAEDHIKESETKYEQLVNRLPEMVFEINNRGRVVFANLRARELTGYSKEELESDFDANRLVAPEDIERSRENMREMFATGMRHSNEYIWVKKDGTRFPVLLTSAPITRDRKVVGARGIIVDMSERKNMEKQLQDNERMATIGQTAGMVGHDIRNPLQAIISELYVAKEAMAQIPEGKGRQEGLESVSFVEEQVDYINKIVSDLQDYARPLNPEYTIVNLPDLIISVFDTIALSDKIKFKVDVKDNLKLKTDPTFLKRTITNLVNNAIQAMPEGGELGLTAQKREKCIVITVSDTGQGIPENVKANLFKPLMTTKAKGQGLGLAVVKRLIEGLNGKVTFESGEGKGTKFIIELPAIG